jgi:hypothetical protein
VCKLKKLLFKINSMLNPKYTKDMVFDPAGTGQPIIIMRLEPGGYRVAELQNPHAKVVDRPL